MQATPASYGEQAGNCDAPSQELADLVLAAGRRGFARWRVATALGISARGLQAIEARIDATWR